VPEFDTPWLRELILPPFRIVYRLDNGQVRTEHLAQRAVDGRSIRRERLASSRSRSCAPVYFGRKYLVDDRPRRAIEAAARSAARAAGHAAATAHGAGHARHAAAYAVTAAADAGVPAASERDRQRHRLPEHLQTVGCPPSAADSRGCPPSAAGSRGCPPSAAGSRGRPPSAAGSRDRVFASSGGAATSSSGPTVRRWPALGPCAPRRCPAGPRRLRRTLFGSTPGSPRSSWPRRFPP
jgi:hypothetical protein